MTDWVHGGYLAVHGDHLLVHGGYLDASYINAPGVGARDAAAAHNPRLDSIV